MRHKPISVRAHHAIPRSLLTRFLRHLIGKKDAELLMVPLPVASDTAKHPKTASSHVAPPTPLLSVSSSDDDRHRLPVAIGGGLRPLLSAGGQVGLPPCPARPLPPSHAA